MNMSADNIILNTCEYTPVYFIENPGVSQARSYVLAPNIQSADKPVSESLKRFYESSGNLESNLTITDNTIKPRTLKKNDTSVVGNNLKLASFLLPKCETKNEISKPVITPVNSVVLKPVYIANNISVNNNLNNPKQAPKIDVNSRLVKLKDLPNIVRSQNGKILPKNKPKENKRKQTAAPTLPVAVPPVQLVKFGETYHSLNQLSTDQMKLVNNALRMFNTQRNPPEPAYDPATNTKFIYKVISHKDFAEQNKVAKQISAEIKREPIKLEKPDIEDEEEEEEEEQKIITEAKVTRSGRVVKLPKNIIEDSPSKPKKRPTALAACQQCNSKFSSPQRLLKHYENHPTHTPSNFHNNLFHCLIAMVTAGPEAERANILLQQLQLLIDRLQACVPCLLKKDAGTETSVISDDISKLFGISPGKYNMNMEALSCEKDKDGYCRHNPRPQITVADNIKPHVKLENIENGVKGPSNILKINFQERRPKILRKVDSRKQKLEQSSNSVNGKKIKLSQDISIDKNSNSVELDDLVALLSDTAKTDDKESKVIDKVVLKDQKEEQNAVVVKVDNVTKPPHIQFHSAHFDIRSSPIKPSSTVFRKFQINPEKMTKYIEVIQPIQLNQLAQDVEITHNIESRLSSINSQEIFSDTNINISKESENLNYTSKNWCEDSSRFVRPNDLKSHTHNFMKPDAVIEPALLHVKNGVRTASESVLKHVNSEPKVENEVANHESLLDSNIFIEDTHIKHDSQVNKAINHIGLTKPCILIEPLMLSQNDRDAATEKVSNQTDSDDFMKSDVLIEKALLNSQECKVIDEITNRSHDFMKSDTLIEQALTHSQDTKIDKFGEQKDSFISSNVYLDPTLPYSSINNENRVSGVTESNEIDVDLNSSQGQSIMSFLESLDNELAYTDTETDRNNVDFHLDLFSFNSS
ncbi:uncharacterized protein LOC123865891 isoform X2 [Maniola jurtina]|uniref:uncharacterized protein LOC123865891 isoform X2 n=1 Tax=Maniola jurtina TaxID=191418 RepID=UPI001E68A0E7|nr:uncharacterized protein LOC123865891 isoform X2 [Maniola jurtina]